MTSHCERLLEVSSRLWDRTQRSCMIRIMTVDSDDGNCDSDVVFCHDSVQRNCCFESRRRTVLPVYDDVIGVSAASLCCYGNKLCIRPHPASPGTGAA